MGATNGFVRRPFVYLGLLQGLAGAALALLLTGVVIAGLNRELRALGLLYEASFSLAGPGLLEASTVLAIGAGLAAAAAWLSSTKYLADLAK
jgi:cell division transport system permease protein